MNNMTTIIDAARKKFMNDLAQSIVDVQPMNMSAKHNIEVGVKKFPENDTVEYYWVKLYSNESIFTMRHRVTDEKIDWCIETFGEKSKDRWITANGVFYFKKESDRTLFVLRWSR